jgi:hypothetical protein
MCMSLARTLLSCHPPALEDMIKIVTSAPFLFFYHCDQETS